MHNCFIMGSTIQINQSDLKPTIYSYCCTKLTPNYSFLNKQQRISFL